MGYLLVTALAVFAVWVVYGQIVNITRANKVGDINNRKLLLISEAVTNLYVAEGISRNIIQNEKPALLPEFHAEIDTIVFTIDSLKQFYAEEEIKTELDSITELLALKEENLKELLAIRQQGATESYYTRVMERLRTDTREDEARFNEGLKNLGPEVRELLLRIETYKQSQQFPETTVDSLAQSQRFPEKTVDSLMNSIRRILSDLETEERQFQSTVSAKENELLENDRQLSSQLREIRSEIEREEIQKTFAQVAESQETLEKTTGLIALIGGGSILVILFFVIMIVRDTNKSQQYRNELEESKNFAEGLLKGREQLMATVTHDLRSPLNTISGYSDLLKKTPLNEKQEHYLDHLKKSSSYSLRLINDLLDLSKLEVGKMTVEELPFNPGDLITESLARAIPAEDPKHLQIVKNLSRNLDRQVVGDPFRIQQILTNLISNAYKFTESGMIEVSGELTGKLEAHSLKISIRDTGIGISKTRQKVIFEEFTQAEDSIEKKYGGFGLGLAISKKMTDLLNGSLQLESEPGKGSVFTVSVPVKTDGTPEKPVSKEIPQEPIQYKKPGAHKILIIDDDPSQLALTTEIIKQSGLVYKSLNDPREALKKLKKEKFDLVLTDIQMPKMNGFQLIRKLKSSPKTADIPVIALSGRTDVHENLYLERGFRANLIKPFSANELLQLIGKTLHLETKTPPQNKTSTQIPVGSKNFSGKGYDLSDIEAFAQNDRESVKEILHTFVESNTQSVENIAISLKNRDLKKLAGTAHKMLPMFRQLKINSLVSDLEILEKADMNILGEKHLELLVERTVRETKRILGELKTEVMNV